MLFKNSRYKNSLPFESHDSTETFRGVRARSVTTLEGVIEHQVKETDRLDLLAQHYYNDSKLWWKILDANPALLSADDLSNRDWIGRAILIPVGRQ